MQFTRQYWIDLADLSHVQYEALSVGFNPLTFKTWALIAFRNSAKHEYLIKNLYQIYRPSRTPTRSTHQSAIRDGTTPNMSDFRPIVYGKLIIPLKF
jgi:hypothetical protein